jgi:hypothetical protein
MMCRSNSASGACMIDHSSACMQSHLSSCVYVYVYTPGADASKSIAYRNRLRFRDVDWE